MESVENLLCMTPPNNKCSKYAHPYCNQKFVKRGEGFLGTRIIKIIFEGGSHQSDYICLAKINGKGIFNEKPSKSVKRDQYHREMHRKVE